MEKLRQAEELDIEYLAQCFVNISRFTQAQASDPYIDGLPTEVDVQTRQFASRYVNHDDAIALIAEIQGVPAGAILAKVGGSSFPPGYQGKAGYISVCWVEEAFQQQGIGRRLLTEVERWLIRQQAGIVELSYLAQNHTAEKTWQQLGFEPFRVSAYKKL